MGDRQRVEQELFARSVGAERVAEQGVFGGLVEGDPLLDAVAETGGDDTGVLGEALGRVAVQPAPVSSSFSGRSQWKRVGTGRTPAATRASTSRS